MLVTVLSLLMPLKPKLFYWTNLLVFYFKSKFYSQTQKIYKQMFIQTCFKPLIVLFNVIIDIPPCNNCVIQFLSCKAIINKLLIYKELTTTISSVIWSCIMLRGQSVVLIAYLEEKYSSKSPLFVFTSTSCFNPQTPDSDWHLLSPYNITLESNIQVTRIKEMITH